MFWWYSSTPIVIVDNVNTVTEAFSLGHINVAQVHLPIGISFFTFQAISYIVDVYTGKTTKQKNIIKVAVYISMFPQLIAGPIVRFCDISRQLSNRVISSENLASGIRRFVIGLGKKVLIANTIAEAVDQIFLIPGAELPMAVAWLGAIGYTLQIYFDFSGYSDMAIGLGRIFGFTYLENFNYPYISRSIREFWRRWHISLSSWFRDYVYFPLGGSRKGKARTYANLLVVFLLCGLWHGASWNFIVWGLLHGGCMVLERVGAERMRVKLWPPLCHLYALLIIIVSWVLFRAETLSAAGHYLQSMFGASQGDSLKFYLSMYVNLEIGVALCLGLLFSTPLYPRLKMYVFQTLESCEKDTPGASARMSLEFAWLVVIFVVLGISIINLASGAYNPFIYFRF